MKTQLYIQGFEVELTDDVQFLLNKEFEDIQNPTVIINEWSKTVSIPFSEANNRLFGYIYKAERMIADDGTPDSYKRMNIYFDPSKKLDFKLVYNSMVVMEGYAKMNEINSHDETGEYNITLFGQLGNMFQEMQKITFDYSGDDQTYVINGAQYVEETINRNLIKMMWDITGQTSQYPQKKSEVGYNVNNIIGFAPNNSFSNNFEYSIFQYLNEGLKFTKVLEDINFKSATGLAPDSVIPNGLLPREIGEYRSYLQLPYIFWNKLFRIFQEKAEQITGYSFDLDSDWFNTSNPDWYNLVYMLKPLNVEDGKMLHNEYNGIYSDTYSQGTILARWLYDNVQSYSDLITGNLYINNVISEQATMLNGRDKLYLINDPTLIKYSLAGGLYTLPADARIKSNNGLQIFVKLTGENNYSEVQSILLADENFTGTYSGQIVKTGVQSDGNIDINTLNFYFVVDKSKFGNYVTMSYSMAWLLNEYPFTGETQFETFLRISTLSFVQANISKEYWFRSGGKFILNDLWNYEYSIFDEILKYCKMYRIGIFVDDFSKTIRFIPLKKYFADYTIEDWSEKLDLSKDYNVKPISFDSKYVLFNYANNQTEIGKQYKEKYGLNYGEYKLNTNYNFNEETKNLFENCKTTITNTDNVLSWNTLYYDRKTMYSFANELFIYNKDASNKQVDTFGTFLYHNGKASFDTSLNMREVNISDDTPFQIGEGKYFYSQNNAYMVVSSTYPNLDIVKGDKICLFNIPKENYTYNNNYADKTSIYDRYWANYINERYSINNKVVSCYLQLTPEDYMNFEFRHFITIDGVLYMVNKIYDYNIESIESTKVDLITINDISGYTA